MDTCSLGPTAQQVLQILRQHRGIPYTVEDLCELIDCQITAIQTVLETLNRQGLIERQESPANPDTYIAL